MQRAVDPPVQAVSRNLVAKLVGGRKNLEKAIKQNKGSLVTFTNYAAVTWRDSTGGRQFVLRGNEKQIGEVMTAIRRNEIDKMVKSTMN